MDNKVMDALKSLVHMDIDAFHSYSQAIKMVELVDVREKLLSFQMDHERHIKDLSAAIHKSGGKPPEFARDFKGFLMEGMTAIVSTMGMEGALAAMRVNEEATNVAYDRAMAHELPDTVRKLVEAGQKDERRHREYIEHAIAQKVWVSGKGSGAVARK